MSGIGDISAAAAATVVLAAAASASAADRLWDFVATGGGSSVFIDVNSKTVTNAQVEFWSVNVNPPAQFTQMFPGVHYILTKSRFDCKARSSQLLESVAYNKSDVLITAANVPSTVQEIKPGSLYDIEFRYLCLGVRPAPTFTMLPHMKDVIAYADTTARPTSDAPSPTD